MSLRARVLEILQDIKDGNQAELGRIAGVGRQAVGQWLNGSVKIVASNPAFKIQDRLGYSARWVIDGTLPKKITKKKELDEGSLVEKGDQKLRVYYLDEQEDELLQVFRRLEPKSRKTAIKQLEILIPEQEDGDAEVLPLKKPVPSNK